MNQINWKILTVIFALGLSAMAQAQITYFDAIGSSDEAGRTANTTLLDGSSFFTTSDNAGDDLWRERHFGNPDGSAGTVSNIFETNAGGAENGPALITTINGLSSGETYNIFAYFWSATDANWRLKTTLDIADFDDNGTPGDITDDFLPSDPSVSFSRNGSATSTQADIVPDANADTFADNMNGQVVARAGNRALYQVLLGEIDADGNGEIKVYIDDLENTSSGNRTWYDGVGYLLGEPFKPMKLIVNLTDGSMTLESQQTTNTQSIKGYSITSAAGALNSDAPASPGEPGWVNIAENYDDNDGDGSISGDWLVLSEAGTRTDLSEGPIYPSDILPGQTIDLGRAFIVNPAQDLTFKYLLEEGQVVTGDVEYTGTFLFGDLNFDGTFDEGDWVVFKAGFNADLSVLSSAEGYTAGDLNGDGLVDVTDLVQFRAAFDAINGAGAFAEMVSDVPEPATLALFGIGGLAMMRRRRRSVKTVVEMKKQCVTKSVAVTAAICLVALVCALPATAGMTYIDATVGASGNTTNANGTEFNPSTSSGGATANDAWHLRTGFANNSDVLASHNGSDSPELKTTITIPDAGTYNIYASFWAGTNPAGNMAWDVAAGFTSGALTDMFPTGGTSEATVAEDYDNTVLALEGNRTLYRGLVGNVTVGDGGSVEVFIDDVPGNASRSWYDGLSFERIYDPLTLQVNITTGDITMLNGSGVDKVGMIHYQVTSEAGQLDAAGLSSLESQAGYGNGVSDDGLGFEVVGTPDANFLGESIFVDSHTFADGDSASLGNIFDTATVEQDRDLVFQYLLEEDGDTMITGIIQYVEGGVVLGDVNGDGLVNGFDVDPFVDVLLNGPYQVEADVNEDGSVDGFDVDPFVALVLGGGSAPQGTQVPEPATLVLLGLGGVAALRRRQ